MKIAYVTTYDANNISNWSGLGYFIWQSLAQRGIEVELIGPLDLPSSIKKILKIKQRFYAKVGHGLYLPDHDIVASKAYARLAWKKLRELDDIEVIVSPGTIPVAFLPGKIPMVTYSDATARALFNSYPAYKHLCPASRRHGDRIERSALERASASVFSSDWAAESAIRDYGANPAKVYIVPLGANFEKPLPREEVIRAIDERSFKKLQLTFIGVEWERKGGPIAIEVVRTLINLGIPAHLTVIGCEPTISIEDEDYVSVRGFIPKSATRHHEILNELGKSHFLIVPSEAECYGLVYCEASAMGVPSIARNVGGVSTIIKNEINGRIFESWETAKDMADWVISYFREPAIYRRLALSSVDEYASRLNWAVAGEKFEQILKDVTKKNELSKLN